MPETRSRQPDDRRPQGEQQVVSDGMEAEQNSTPDDLAEIKLFVPQDIYRAFQRCVWIQVHETGRSQLEVMEELVDDFLRKYEC